MSSEGKHIKMIFNSNQDTRLHMEKRTKHIRNYSFKHSSSKHSDLQQVDDILIDTVNERCYD